MHYSSLLLLLSTATATAKPTSSTKSFTTTTTSKQILPTVKQIQPPPKQIQPTPKQIQPINQPIDQVAKQPIKQTQHNITTYKQTYTLNSTSQSYPSFFNAFNFEDNAHPAGSGFASYVNQSYAASNNMIGQGSAPGSVRIGVDYTSVLQSNATEGRKAIRLDSKVVYGFDSLFVADFTHMPGGICGTWPAFWMSGPSWPTGGELDILEGVNTNPTNKITGYTNATGTCTNSPLLNAKNSITYNLTSTDCKDLDDSGCSMQSSDAQSYGSGFNANNGGIFAAEWTKNTGIKVWFFARGSKIPTDIASGKEQLDPSGWGVPAAAIPADSCDMQTHFYNMQIVLNTNFCGGWAKRTWKSGGCAALADTCEDYVSKFPGAFQNAYWEVNYIKTYSGKNVSSVVTVNDTNSSVTTSKAPASAKPPAILGWLTGILKGLH